MTSHKKGLHNLYSETLWHLVTLCYTLWQLVTTCDNLWHLMTSCDNNLWHIVISCDNLVFVLSRSLKVDFKYFFVIWVELFVKGVKRKSLSTLSTGTFNISEAERRTHLNDKVFLFFFQNYLFASLETTKSQIITS